MYFLYSLGGVTFNKCWITLSILNFYSPNFQGFSLMKNALNNQVGMLGDMFLWLVANLKQGVIYSIKQALPPNISAGSVALELFLDSFPNMSTLTIMCANTYIMHHSSGSTVEIIFRQDKNFQTWIKFSNFKTQYQVSNKINWIFKRWKFLA